MISSTPACDHFLGRRHPCHAQGATWSCAPQGSAMTLTGCLPLPHCDVLKTCPVLHRHGPSTGCLTPPCRMHPASTQCCTPCNQQLPTAAEPVTSLTGYPCPAGCRRLPCAGGRASISSTTSTRWAGSAPLGRSCNAAMPPCSADKKAGNATQTCRHVGPHATTLRHMICMPWA